MVIFFKRKLVLPEVKIEKPVMKPKFEIKKFPKPIVEKRKLFSPMLPMFEIIKKKPFVGLPKPKIGIPIIKPKVIKPEIKITPSIPKIKTFKPLITPKPPKIEIKPKVEVKPKITPFVTTKPKVEIKPKVKVKPTRRYEEYPYPRPVYPEYIYKARFYDMMGMALLGLMV